MRGFSVAVAVAAVCVMVATGAMGARESDRILSLPGLSQPLPTMYSGLLDITETEKMFYWFVQAEKNHETAPLLTWLTGGPGCSGLGALMGENGPFFAGPNKTLIPNPWSWHTLANVLYLESPVGVGFSHSTNFPSVYKTGDEQTTNNTYIAVQAFLDAFPEYRPVEFRVTGESYGGHYVPLITAWIYEANKAAPQDRQINLKGMAVGNAWTYSRYDNEGCVMDWFSHTLISEETADGMMKTCQFDDIGPLAADAAADGPTPNPTKCNEYYATAMKEMGNIDIYDIYQDVCLSTQEIMGQGHALARQLAKGPAHSAHAIHGSALDALFSQRRVDAIPPSNPAPVCVDEYMTQYLNDPEVQKAIHAPSLPYKWASCSNIVDYNYQDLLSSVMPVYEKILFPSDLDIRVYSGDVDAIVPTPGTKLWINALEPPLTVSDPFRSWTVPQTGQVGGWTTKYDNGFMFSTVRNAGHMVPGTQPVRSWVYTKAFIEGSDLPQ